MRWQCPRPSAPSSRRRGSPTDSVRRKPDTAYQAGYNKSVLADEIIRVEPLMREIEDRVRDDLRRRLLARGGAPEYQDPEVFRSVDRLLRRAADRPDEHALLPEFLGPESDWRIQTHVRFVSHRPVTGPLVLFVKRRILLPLTRWLYEYTVDNFERQERVNRMLVACIEELAIENARLRRDLVQHGGRVTSTP